MAGQKSNSKNQRTHRVSAGERRSCRTLVQLREPFSEIQKVLQGGGSLDSFAHVECKGAWRGAAGLPKSGPYDPAQALINREIYPHLFGGGR